MWTNMYGWLLVNCSPLQNNTLAAWHGNKINTEGHFKYKLLYTFHVISLTYSNISEISDHYMQCIVKHWGKNHSCKVWESIHFHFIKTVKSDCVGFASLGLLVNHFYFSSTLWLKKRAQCPLLIWILTW